MFKQPLGTLEHAIKMGLSSDEYNRINEILGRQANYTELSIFSVMWSEHCSYKNSIVEIKKLPRSGKRCLVEAGEENAGMIDIGDGLAIAFKIESHNHPSAIEPYQGAATGVGGIMRDIFTMGARPLACLNSLRFGNLSKKQNRYLFRNVVKGIGDYGNCLGIPNIGGEVYFDDTYSDNPLVNAMAIGILKADKMASATAGRGKNLVFIFGASTGRDGIHGATFASVELTAESESKKSSVQVGDPFMEKLLLEASLEMINSDILVGIQDMGAAGITCSTSEMSGKTGSGMKINLEKVPLREEDMNPYEIMLSESQERMLAVIQKGKEGEIKNICEKWDILCEEIGIVTDDGKVSIYWHSQLVAEVPAFDLVLGGGAPVYIRDVKKPTYIDEKNFFNMNLLPQTDLREDFFKLLKSPNLISRNWIYRQFDTQVRTNTTILPGGDASMFRIKGTNKAIASKIDCNARYVYLNPKRGAQIAVCESARNVSCVGAEPVGITNNLNFGNPYNPEMYYLFQESVDGIRQACESFKIPVTGGNVSFYNESENSAVYPTPTIGMIGLLEDYTKAIQSFFQQEGDLIYILGQETQNELGASEWLKIVHNKVAGEIPRIDLAYEGEVQKTLRNLINARLIQSAHDCSDGGLIFALLESCLNPNGYLGVDVHFKSRLKQRELFFSETQSRIIISIKIENEIELLNMVKETSIRCEKIGTVKDKLTFCINNFRVDNFENDVINPYLFGLKDMMQE